MFAIFKIFRKFRNGMFAECPPIGTRQTPLCRVPTSRHSANNLVLPSAFFCRVFFRWHLANRLFAECPKNCTRQTPWHSAMFGFPVVYLAYITNRICLSLADSSFSYVFRVLCSFRLCRRRAWAIFARYGQIPKPISSMFAFPHVASSFRANVWTFC